MLSALVTLPSTALTLPEVPVGRAADVARLRERTDAVCQHLAGHPVVVVAADPAAAGRSAPVGLAPPDGTVHLGGLGLPDLRAVAARPAEGTDGCMEVAAVHPGADLAVLAVLAARAGATDVRLVALPSCDDGGDRWAAAAAAAAASLIGLAAADDLAVATAGDLAAGHGPKPPRPGVGQPASERFDEVVIAALGDPDGLTRLGGAATAAAARGLPALLLAALMARHHHLVPADPHPAVVDGVATLCCAWTTSAAAVSRPAG